MIVTDMDAPTDCPTEGAVADDSVDMAKIGEAPATSLKSEVTDATHPQGTEPHAEDASDDETVTVEGKHTKSVDPSNLDIFDAETDSESDESEDEAVTVKRPRARAALLSDDEDDSDADEKPGEEALPTKPTSDDTQGLDTALPGSLLSSDLFAADTDSEPETGTQKLKRGGRAVVLRDDEDENEEADSSIDHSTVVAPHAGGSDSEHGSGSDGETSSKRLGRPKDGLSDGEERPNQEERAKSKGTRVQKPRRLKKEAIQKIHSESQRLVRESALRLPYHKPKQMTVNDFFSKKPTAIRPIKPKKGPMSSFIEESKPKQAPQKDDLVDLPDPFATTTAQVGKGDVSPPEDRNSNDTVQPVPLNTDIVAANVSTEVSPVVGSSPKDSAMPIEEVTAEINESGDKTQLGENIVDQHQDGNTSHQTNKEDTPMDAPIEGESPPKSGGGLGQSSDDSIVQESVGSAKKTTPPSSTAKKQSATMRLLQASLDKFRNITPKLSGEGERVIQLDEEVEAKLPAGVENLMKRFVKHSDKKRTGPKKKSQEVQLSIVKKETSEDGKESLKQESISVILEPDEQEINPKLKVPGAKLTHLKDTLQQRMKARREEERRKRQEAYNIDNEDMDGEEEEAEMSSDDEEDVDHRAKTGDSEDDDDDYVPEEDLKEKHEFADDEADEDSDGEDGDVDDEEMETDPLKVGGVEAINDDGKVPSQEEGDESGDEISPSRKTKAATKRRIILSDDEDGDEPLEAPGQESSAKEIKTCTPVKATKEVHLHNETSNLSSISSKASSVKKSDSSSVVNFYHDPGKTLDLFDSTSSLTDVKCNDLSMEEKQTSFNLKDRFGSVTSRTPEPDTASLESSFEMFPSTIPPYQPRRESLDEDEATKESFKPFSQAKTDLERSSLSKTTIGKFPDLSMPVEDSQDLFRPDTPSLRIPDSQLETETQNFKFSFEEDDTQSQFLDANGFLKLKSSSAKRPPPRKIFDSDNATQGTMDELLGLCSGQFNGAGGSASTEVLSSQTSFKKGLFSQAQSQDNFSELLGLCSGNFSSKPKEEDKFSEIPKKDSDNESTCSFSLVLDRDRLKEEMAPSKPESSDDDEPIILTRKKKRRPESVAAEGVVEDEGLLLAYDSNDEEPQVNKRAFKGVTYSKFAKKKFFEAEAELSGSDADSDEDYDAEDEPDELEMDREVEQQFKDTEKLREEVNEIYMKDIDDDDARKLRMYKEMLLRDGDLHSDKTRVRKFRWKNLAGAEMDLGAGDGTKDSDDEEAEQDDEETKWRLLRHEREQWLKKQEAEKKTKSSAPVEEPVAEEENSQFALFMKKVSRNNSRGSSSSLETVTSNTAPQAIEVKDKKVFNSPKPLKMHKHGSFLKRKKHELEKLASVVKPVTNPTAPKSNRGFIFQSVSSSEPEKPSQQASVKRSMSVPDVGGPEAPKSKRPKLDRSSSQRSSQSIFDHF